MKKVLLVVLAILITATFVFSAEEANVGESKLTWAGWDTIVYGWPKLNDAGQITSVQGISILGYTWRSYFKPMEPEKVNFYWEVGPNALVLGLNAGAGITYPLPMKDSRFDYLYLSGGLNVFWGVLTAIIPIPAPWIGVTVTF